MSPRYTGRHTGSPERPAPRPATGPARPASPRARQWRKLALWIGLTACVAFTLFVVAGFFGLLHDFDHPGNDGWLCSPNSSTCRP